MPTRLVRAVVTLVLSLCLTVTGSAAGARFWQVATQADFLKGDVSNLSIDLHGRLVLGPETTAVGSTSTPFLWTMVAAPDGSVYVGSGNAGEVLRFTPDGKQSVFFDSAELEVHALALASNGDLYVGTSPEGRIYKVNAQGAATTYFDPEDKYIWALAVDDAGTLYAATGEKGIIYRITAEGDGKPFYQTKATHARTLTFDRNGNLLAGTESPGKVFRIDKNGAGFVLLDSGLQEISALRVDARGVVYAGGLTGRPSPDRGPDRPPVEPSRSPAPIPTVSTEITSITIVDATGAAPGGTSQPPRQERRSIRGAVYRILPDGVWDTLWSSQDDAPYDLLPDKDGSLLVATGNPGKLYRIEADPARTTLIVSPDAQQVTTLLRDKSDRLWLATANSGKVFRLSSARATKGTYESTVRDAETVATWGSISWRGSLPSGSTIKLFTRSGNTAVPDETWSAWSAPYTKAAGEQVTSPKARYLQWKAELAGTATSSPVVTSVTVAYLQRNLRPEISAVTVYPPGVVFQKPFSTGDAEIAGFDGTTADRRAAAAAQSAAQSGGVSASSPPLGRRGYEKGLQTFLWKAEDGNEDDLQFEIQYRREGDTTWKVLKRGLTEPLYVWDTTSVPNGTYVVKVIASDSPSNPPGNALIGERESESLDIDNAPPDIVITSLRRDGGRSVVAFSVKDDHSAVERVEYSLDGDRWRAIHPKDGIADSVSEEFELALDGDTSGRAVIIRAEDAMENVTTTRAEAPVSSR